MGRLDSRLRGNDGQLHRIVIYSNLQNRLGMDASSVPTLTLVRVTPSEVFEVTNLLLAEMARMKMHLSIELPHASLGEERNKTPADVFAQVLRMIKNLDALAEAAAQT